MKNQPFSTLDHNKPQGLQDYSGSTPRYIVMAKKFIISFFLCISILILSEYFFLQEMYGEKRALIILLTAIGVIASVLSFWFFFKQYSRTIK